MKLPNVISFFVLSLLLISGCVSQKSYQELEEVKNYYALEAETADSISNANRILVENDQYLESQLRQTTHELEQLTVTNISLNRSFQELLDKYNRIVNQSRDVLTTTSYEKLGLEQQLAAQMNALDEKERKLNDLEMELYQKEARLNMVEYNYNSLEGNMFQKNRKIRELEAMLNLKEEKMKELRARINQALQRFSDSDLSIEDRNGKIYVTLSQDLLFKSGGAKVDYKGKMALRDLAKVLNNNPDIDITVEGHTDSDGSASKNWDLSTSRATAVVKILTSYGLDPSRLTASGRSLYLPLVPNNTAAGKALNRRTEIILSPKLDELYELINN